ncbi:hypothetical protein N8I77_007363 [Diaporthe amygdali]|uniref:Uncharacterized protein n=1 Tax=Phomopsis amygdali TaxID=1214568 RepID=A0AAD9W3D0_PHOAM|nr:hypothetical protein N8I77_007363 [Diaporthe amygdali]
MPAPDILDTQVNFQPMEPYIFKLPEEVLIKTFEAVKGDLTEPPLKITSRDPVDNLNIQQVRLTCRRFCNTSSHLLLPYLDIDMSSPSLAHLNEISRHPTISKGVRTLRVHVGFYSAALADDFVAFTEVCFANLMGIFCRGKPETTPKWATYVPGDTKRRLFAEGDRILDLWAKSKFKPPEDPQSEETKLDVATLREAHELYQQLFKDQESVLRGNTFLQAIEAAARRMPSMDSLSITDLDRMPWPRRDWSRKTLGEDPDQVNGHTILVESVTVRKTSWADHEWLGAPPLSTFYRLPLAIRAAGTSLVQLRILMSSLSELQSSLDDDYFSGLRAAVTDLRVFEIERSQGSGTRLSDKEPLKQRPEYFHRYVSTVVEARNLQRAKLDLNHVRMVDGPDLYWSDVDDVDEDLPVEYDSGEYEFGMEERKSAIALLASRTWPCLRSLAISRCVMSLEQLRGLCNVPEINLTLQDVYMRSGTWAEVLEIIRSSSNTHFALQRLDGREFVRCTKLQPCHFRPESASLSGVEVDELPARKLEAAEACFWCAKWSNLWWRVR